MPIYRQLFRSDPRKVWTSEQYQHGAELVELVNANADKAALQFSLMTAARTVEDPKLEAAIEASPFRVDSTGQWWFKTGTRKVMQEFGQFAGKEIPLPVTVQVPTPAVLEPAPLGKSQPVQL